MLVISIVKSSLALSLGLTSAFNCEFRAAIKEPEELSYSLVIAIGLGLGAGQQVITVIAIIVILIILRVKNYISEDVEELTIGIQIFTLQLLLRKVMA